MHHETKKTARRSTSYLHGVLQLEHDNNAQVHYATLEKSSSQPEYKDANIPKRL